MYIFLNTKKQLRGIWWIATFFLILAALTFPLILLSQHYKWELTIGYQALVIVATTLICQLLRKKALSELTGVFNLTWVKDFMLGLLLGAALMLLPAFFLFMCGFVKWQLTSVDPYMILSVTGVFAVVAIAEEFLFRGFIFQRLMESTGIWITQLLIAGYFLLIHLNNPGMTDSIKLLASANIFLASIMFGLAFIKTKSLALPLALHFMANWVQGTLLGFGVSGQTQESLIKPIIKDVPQWVTGGSFGLEASLPGLISVSVLTILLYKWKPAASVIDKT